MYVFVYWCVLSRWIVSTKLCTKAILQLCSYRQDWGGEQSGLLFLRHNSCNRLKKSSQRKSTREGQWVASVLARPFSLVTVALRAFPFLWNLKNTFTLALGRPCSAVRTFKLYVEVVCIRESILVCTSLPCLKRRCLMFRLHPIAIFAPLCFCSARTPYGIIKLIQNLWFYMWGKV